MPAGDTLIQCAGCSRLHALKESLGAATVQRGQVIRRALHVDAMTDGRQRAECEGHGGEGEATVPRHRPSEVQGTLAGMIARQKERPAVTSPSMANAKPPTS